MGAKEWIEVKRDENDKIRAKRLTMFAMVKRCDEKRTEKIRGFLQEHSNLSMRSSVGCGGSRGVGRLVCLE